MTLKIGKCYWYNFFVIVGIIATFAPMFRREGRTSMKTININHHILKFKSLHNGYRNCNLFYPRISVYRS
jgi:hypothetical protein